MKDGMFKSDSRRENNMYHNKLFFKDWKYQIKFISIDWRRITKEMKWRTGGTGHCQVLLKTWTTCELLEQKLTDGTTF